MIIRLDAYDLKHEFEAYDRDYYSEDGYEAILDYYDEDEELDVIAICGDFSEYGDCDCTLSFRSLLNDYGYLLDCGGYSEAQLDALENGEEDDEGNDWGDVINEVVSELEYHTYVQKLPNGNIMVQDF